MSATKPTRAAAFGTMSGEPEKAGDYRGKDGAAHEGGRPRDHQLRLLGVIYPYAPRSAHRSLSNERPHHAQYVENETKRFAKPSVERDKSLKCSHEVEHWRG